MHLSVRLTGLITLCLSNHSINCSSNPGTASAELSDSQIVWATQETARLYERDTSKLWGKKKNKQEFLRDPQIFSSYMLWQKAAWGSAVQQRLRQRVNRNSQQPWAASDTRKHKPQGICLKLEESQDKYQSPRSQKLKLIILDCGWLSCGKSCNLSSNFRGNVSILPGVTLIRWTCQLILKHHKVSGFERHL